MKKLILDWLGIYKLEKRIHWIENKPKFKMGDSVVLRYDIDNVLADGTEHVVKFIDRCMDGNVKYIIVDKKSLDILRVNGSRIELANGER